MFDIGFFELLICTLLALIVLGPKRLPHAAYTLGLWLGKIKGYFAGMKQEFEDDMYKSAEDDTGTQNAKDMLAAAREMSETPDEPKSTAQNASKSTSDQS